MFCKRCDQLIGDNALHDASCPATTRSISFSVDLPDDREITRNDVLGALGSGFFNPLERFVEDVTGHRTR